MHVIKWIIRSIAVAVSVLAMQGAAAQQAPLKMRISIDSPPAHLRTKIMQDYIEAVKQKAGGRLEIELFHSAQLFNDRDVPKALRQNAVEMAAPGTWVLGGLEPRLNALSLPVFYGATAQEMRRAYQGPIGIESSKGLEQKLDIKVLPEWLELGASHFYGVSKPIRTHDDLKGLLIRNPGGVGNDMRIKFFHANSVNVPWPDMPLAMSQGKFDAFISTHESVASAKLWESGMKYAFEDNQSFGLYVPMINGSFWKKLSPELQKILTVTWTEQAPAQREAFATMQAKARETMLANGIQIVTPDQRAKTAVRARLHQLNDEFVKGFRLEPEFAAQAVRFARGE